MENLSTNEQQHKKIHWKLVGRLTKGSMGYLVLGALFLLLLILLAIEAHQDRVLNEIAAQEDRDTD